MSQTQISTSTKVHLPLFPSFHICPKPLIPFFNYIDNCFDFLRQAVICHGDISMTYWWNNNYTTSLPDGTQVHSDWFNAATGEEREKSSFVFWDIEHSCRMQEPIDAWIEKHSPLPPGVKGEFKETTKRDGKLEA